MWRVEGETTTKPNQPREKTLVTKNRENIGGFKKRRVTISTNARVNRKRKAFLAISPFQSSPVPPVLALLSTAQTTTEHKTGKKRTLHDNIRGRWVFYRWQRFPYEKKKRTSLINLQFPTEWKSISDAGITTRDRNRETGVKLRGIFAFQLAHCWGTEELDEQHFPLNTFLCRWIRNGRDGSFKLEFRAGMKYPDEYVVGCPNWDSGPRPRPISPMDEASATHNTVAPMWP